MLAWPTVNWVIAFLSLKARPSRFGKPLHIADHLGMVRSFAELARGRFPQTCAEVGERRGDAERMGQVVGGADILGHQAQRKSVVERFRNDELLELELGGVVLARGSIEDVRH